MFPTIGFIGCGNMGAAMARAIRVGGPTTELFFANRSPQKAQLLADQLVGQVADNGWIAANCSLIVLGVKPQMMGEVLAEIKESLASRKDRFVLLTMAAGLTMQTVRDMAGGAWPVARIMPNTPCAIGAGVIQYCGLGVTEEELNEFAALLKPAGLVDKVEERLIDAASAVSGCGPAFAYLFMEALADGAVACGLPRDKAMAYAAQMVEGSARMVLESGKHPGVLKDAVCSPGGTTIQGVRALEEGGFRAAAMNAVIKAYEKTLTLK
jgi:pyrroline-5-carboxylate reductase